jgi:hypothetical protein
VASEIWRGRLHQNRVGSTLPECGLYVPKEDCPVQRPQGEDFPVRGEGYGVDIVRMPLEGAEQRPCGHVPELDRGVPGPRGEDLPVRGEGHREDVRRMPGEGADVLRAQDPHGSGGTIVTSRDFDREGAVPRKRMREGYRSCFIWLKRKGGFADGEAIYLAPDRPCPAIETSIHNPGRDRRRLPRKRGARAYVDFIYPEIYAILGYNLDG